VCGIAGRVDFAEDLTSRGDAVAAMAEAVACRGPDGEGLWTGRHVALGHRRLAVIDVEGGAQPMLASGPVGVVAAITYNGETYNFRELRADLTARGHRFRTRCDTEVVLRAYLAWGRRFVERLRGMYAFALWDAGREELLLVRDHLGVKPLFYAPTAHGVLFGSEPKAILAHPGFEAAVDEEGLRAFLASASAPGVSIWRGIREVGPGELVTVGRDGCRAARYWALEARPHEDDLPATVRTTRDLLEEAVGQQLVSDVPLCALLSGGLDSSLLAALAARRSAGGRVRSFSVDFEGYEEGFRSDGVRPAPDAPYVREMVAHADLDHTDVVLDSARLGDAAARREVVRAYDRPSRRGEMDTSLLLLLRAVRRGSTVALSGEGADELFGGYVWFHDPDEVGAATFPWLAATHGFARFSVLRPEVEARLRLDEYRHQCYLDAVAEVPHLGSDGAGARRMREVSHLHLTRYLPDLLVHQDRLGMAAGLEVRVPYCDVRLVEYAYNVPWELMTFDGREKSLLRAAAADLLPRSILERRKSHYPSTRDEAYAEAVGREFLDLLGRPGARVFDLVDHGRVRLLARDVGRGASRVTTRRWRELVLALDLWLSEYRPRCLL